jgi:ABC-2 type transport system permease protein
MKRAMTIARREYLTTVKRRAFLFTVIFMPVYFTGITALTGGFASSEVRRNIRETNAVGVVDSSGAFANAPDSIKTEVADEKKDANIKVVGSQQQQQAENIQRITTYSAVVRRFASQQDGERALRAGEIRQLLVVPQRFLETGEMRRYKTRQSVFSSGDERMMTRWVSRSMIRGLVDSVREEVTVRPTRRLELYTLDRTTDTFTKYDDAREMVSVFLPILIVALLGTSIITGGQYLLQGVSEERESRILESLLCTVSTDDIMVGKLVGLGGAGLTMVGVWTAVGAYLGAPYLALTQTNVPVTLAVFGVVYFLLGYVFYGSIMTAIGAITSNLREAQQYAMLFTFSVFAPFVVMWLILERPEGPVATIMSIFPLTAATTMLMRLATGFAVPAWQLAASIGMMLLAAWFALVAGSKVFRLGLLLYGKTPNLPEIMKWIGSRG